jgi:hypothetical protein
MAQLKISFEGTAGTVTKSGANWNAGKETRFLNWIWTHYAPVDEDPESETFGEVLARNNANEAQAFKNFGFAIMQGVKANIERWEREEAIKAIIPVDL